MRWFIALGLAAFVFAAISRIPLAWVGSHIQTPPAVNPQYLGTIWKGAVTDIPGVAPVKFKTEALKLIGGKALTFSSSSSGLTFSGDASLSQAVNIKVRGNMAALSKIENRLSGLEGDYNLVISDMKIGEVCERGEGSVSTDILARNHANWQWRGPKLSGPIRCENGQIVIKMTGSESGQDFNSDLRLALDGNYRLTVDIKTADQRASLVLPIYGFEAAGGGFRLSEAGKWR